VAKRFLDLTGAADDDGEAGIYDLATEFLVEPNVHKSTMSRRVRHHVARS
jgi:hypothetical protein